MAHTRKTLILNDKWDLCLTPGYVWRKKIVKVDGVDTEITYKASPLQVAEGGYATAQNVANECRLFTQDAYFDQERGIPYYLIALGHKVSPSVLRARLHDAALLVEDVAEITEIKLDALDTETRRITGDIQFTSKEGENAAVNL